MAAQLSFAKRNLAESAPVRLLRLSIRLLQQLNWSQNFGQTLAKIFVLKVEMPTRIDFLNPNDIPELLAIAHEIGWGYNPSNWLCFMSLGIVIGHRNSEGKPISSAVMIKYNENLRWLTSFIVSPRWQRQGLARELWAFLEKETETEEIPVGLISTEEGLAFYEAMGFHEVGSVHKFVRANGLDIKTSFPDRSTFQRILETDLSEIVDLDKATVGVSRATMIEAKMKDAVQSVKTRDEKNNLNGFAFGVMEGSLLCIGPVVASDEETALQLILSVAKNHSGQMRLDIKSGNPQLMAALKQNGFLEERCPPILSYKNRNLPKTSPNYFAIAAQALG